MNLLLENSTSVEAYTYLDELFEAIPRLQSYIYLLSDLEATNWSRGESPITISGSDLFKTISSSQVQFIWGVLSAFTDEPVTPDDLPYADGNATLWKPNSIPQCSGAEFEIVCWDSGATLFIGVDDTFAADLREVYPDIKCLDSYIHQLA